MKVGTDGVLLGAWARVEGVSAVCDVGSGTGLIALMAAQRNPEARISAIEIDDNAFVDLTYNIDNSSWRLRIEAHHCDYLAWHPATEAIPDCFVSNPPFFDETLRSPDRGRALARHISSLTLPRLLQHSYNISSPKAIFSLILPFSHRDRLIEAATFARWNVSRLTTVSSLPGRVPSRLLVELVKNNTAITTDSLYLQAEDGQRSDDFRELTKDFYIK